MDPWWAPWLPPFTYLFRVTQIPRDGNPFPVCAHNPVNCPAVICLPRMAILSSFGRETSLVNIMGPRSIFPILFTPLIYFFVAITIIIIPCVLSFVNNKAGGIDNLSVLVGSKVICCVCRSTPTANLWRRCHLPVVVGVLLDTNLGILTEGNLLLSTSQPSTLGNQRRGVNSYHQRH